MFTGNSCTFSRIAGLQGNSELLIIATATIVTAFKEIYSCRGGCSISRPLRAPNHVGHQCKSSIKTKSQTNAMLPKSDRRAIPSPSGQNNSKMCRIKYTSPSLKSWIPSNPNLRQPLMPSGSKLVANPRKPLFQAHNGYTRREHNFFERVEFDFDRIRARKKSPTSDQTGCRLSSDGNGL